MGIFIVIVVAFNIFSFSLIFANMFLSVFFLRFILYGNLCTSWT